jgi:thioredoxin reductase (NADPH)
MENVKVLIVGSGPAGCTAAIYTGRANLSPVLYEGNQPGGQLTTTSDIENFPGYPEGINGTEMMKDLMTQAKRFGADVRSKEIVELDLSKRPFKAVDEDGSEILAETVILCTGASARYLGLAPYATVSSIANAWWLWSVAVIPLAKRLCISPLWQKKSI